MHTRADCAAMDDADPLRDLRERFEMPEGVIYLDGNSLGPLPKATPARIDAVMREQWGRDLIASWNDHDWIGLPAAVGGKIARLIGAGAHEVVAADSTSVNFFKMLAMCLALRPERRRIVSERLNFPTDLYMIDGLLRLLGPAYALTLVESEAAIAEALGDDVAVLALTHVDYRTGRLHDMAALTARAHAAGALALWDLSHSAGALPVDLNGAGVDAAVGCTYKYLNGGPGGTAYLYVAERWHAAARQPLSGWMGHASPFDFDHRYVPGDGMARHQCGTPQILSLAAVDAGLDAMEGVSVAALRAKSWALAEVFIGLVDGFAGQFGLMLATPRDGALRGSQVCWRHPHGHAVIRAVIERGVIGDFRAPDILRFGLTPMTTRFVDMFDAAETMRAVLEGEEWRGMERAGGVVT